MTEAQSRELRVAMEAGLPAGMDEAGRPVVVGRVLGGRRWGVCHVLDDGTFRQFANLPDHAAQADAVNLFKSYGRVKGWQPALDETLDYGEAEDAVCGVGEMASPAREDEPTRPKVLWGDEDGHKIGFRQIRRGGAWALYINRHGSWARVDADTAYETAEAAIDDLMALAEVHGWRRATDTEALTGTSRGIGGGATSASGGETAGTEGLMRVEAEVMAPASGGGMTRVERALAAFQALGEGNITQVEGQLGGVYALGEMMALLKDGLIYTVLAKIRRKGTWRQKYKSWTQFVDTCPVVRDLHLNNKTVREEVRFVDVIGEDGYRMLRGSDVPRDTFRTLMSFAAEDRAQVLSRIQSGEISDREEIAAIVKELQAERESNEREADRLRADLDARSATLETVEGRLKISQSRVAELDEELALARSERANRSVESKLALLRHARELRVELLRAMDDVYAPDEADWPEIYADYAGLLRQLEVDVMQRTDAIIG